MAREGCFAGRRSAREESKEGEGREEVRLSLPLPFPAFPLFSRVLRSDDVAEDDYHDYHERRRWQASREVAQTRDDENIGSISKFYFGASAERRSYTQFTASRTRFCPRARNFTRFSPLSLSLFPIRIRWTMLLKDEFSHECTSISRFPPARCTPFRNGRDCIEKCRGAWCNSERKKLRYLLKFRVRLGRVYHE